MAKETIFFPLFQNVVEIEKNVRQVVISDVNVLYSLTEQ